MRIERKSFRNNRRQRHVYTATYNHHEPPEVFECRILCIRKRSGIRTRVRNELEETGTRGKKARPNQSLKCATYNRARIWEICFGPGEELGEHLLKTGRVDKIRCSRKRYCVKDINQHEESEGTATSLRMSFVWVSVFMATASDFNIAIIVVFSLTTMIASSCACPRLSAAKQTKEMCEHHDDSVASFWLRTTTHCNGPATTANTDTVAVSQRRYRNINKIQPVIQSSSIHQVVPSRNGRLPRCECNYCIS
jgi:hypothetical protein